MTDIEINDFKSWNKFQQKLSKSVNDKKGFPANKEFPYLESQSVDGVEILKSVLNMMPQVGDVLSGFASIIWETTKGTDGSSELWNSFSIMVEQAIDTKLDEHTNTLINSIIGEIKTATAEYTKKKSNLKSNPTDDTLKNECKKQFDDLEDKVRAALNDDSLIRSKLYGYQQLAKFIIIATTHLFILKDVIENGLDWNFSAESIADYTSFYSSILPNYIRHTKAAYEIGVQNIKNLPNISALEKINRVFKYRSHCARFCFDYIETIWIPMNKKLEGGIYVENVRYLWGDVLGHPTANTFTLEKASYEAIENAFINCDFDLYKKDFTKVEIVHNKKAIQGLISTYSGSETLGYGKGLTDDTVITSFEVPVDSNKSSLSGKYDPAPFQIQFNFKTTTTFNPTDSLNYGSEFYRLANLMINSGRPVSNYGVSEGQSSYPNHKVATMVGGSYTHEMHGYLDSIFTGLLPLSVFKENYLFKNKGVMINAQKYSAQEGASFKRDHFLPTVHSMFIPINGSLTFKLLFIQDKPTVTRYRIGLRYHFSGTNSTAQVNIFKPNGELWNSIQLQKCEKEDTNGFNQYKIAFATGKVDFANFPEQLQSNILSLKLVSKNNIFLHSLILFPTKIAEIEE